MVFDLRDPLGLAGHVVGLAAQAIGQVVAAPDALLEGFGQ